METDALFVSPDSSQNARVVLLSVLAVASTVVAIASVARVARAVETSDEP